MIDVLMCLYDYYWDASRRLDWINLSIRSILNQTFKDFEFIIVSDGATKEAIDLVKSLAKDDVRIILYEREHKGRASALDFGVSKCSAEFIAFQDGDDISTNDRLEKQLFRISIDDKLGCVGCWYYGIDKDGKILTLARTENPDNLVLSQLPGTIGTAMYRKKALDEMGSFRFDLAQDYYSFVKLKLLGWKLANANCPLWLHRVHGGSLTSRQRDKQKEVERIVFDEVLKSTKTIINLRK